MLNELAALGRSPESRGIHAQAWHPWIKTYKKAEAIVAELDEYGSLSRVSVLSAEEVAALRNIAPDFHNGRCWVPGECSLPCWHAEPAATMPRWWMHNISETSRGKHKGMITPP